MDRRPIPRPDGVSEFLQFDADNETAHLVRSADVEPIIEANKRAAADNPSGFGPSREWRKVASIPIVIQLQWIERYGADPLAPGNEGLLRRVLNDPEWRYLRTSTVIV